MKYKYNTNYAAIGPYPWERTCPATVKHIVEAVGSLLPHHFPVPRPHPHPRAPASGPTKFAIYYEHHGDSMIRRAGLSKSKVAGHVIHHMVDPRIVRFVTSSGAWHSMTRRASWLLSYIMNALMRCAG